MSYQMTGSHVMASPILQTVERCAVTCEQMITHLLRMTDVNIRTMQIQILRDCATICETMVCYLARESLLSRALAAFCAYVCEVCGRECARFPDSESQHCSHICLHCAQECRAFAYT